MDNSSECEPDSNDGEESLPNVRRPMNAFFIFCKRHRNIVREKYPHLENRSITKILGEWWANLDQSEKASYTTLAKQYKEAFMKAHPDFKWYKLPAPPARTLVTRPSNHRANQIQNDKNGHQYDNCGITLGKLVDDEQLGNLSSLINTSVSGSLSASADCATLQNSSMAQKGTENILKPPKKRYLINGEFQSHPDTSSVDSRDFQTRNACSALLELAEICTNTSILEASAAMNSAYQLNNSVPFVTPPSNRSKYSSPHSDSFDSSVSRSTATPNSQKSEKGFQNLSFTSLNICSKDKMQNGEDKDHIHQEQPLDLCKNKDKTKFLCKEDSSKTITTSHQQLIDHFVDKFLCDTPVSPNKFYKSEIIDPAFCKLFSERNLSVPSSSAEGKVSRSAFTLSVAIESAVDKAYSKEYLNSNCKEIPESNIVLDCVANDSHELNVQFKVGDDKITSKPTSDLQPVAKSSEQSLETPSSSTSDEKIKTLFADSTSIDVVSSAPNSCSQIPRDKESTDSVIPECSSSKYFCKLITPPKKSSVWCSIFMNEQLTKSSIDNNSHVVNSLGSDASSPARRSSQRTCKGRRYQALITEGLLQSPKERKQSNAKKTVSPLNKAKNKISLVTENHVFNSQRKKRKKEYPEKRNSHTDAYGLGPSLFNLEEKIASLPKCSLEHLKKKKKIAETSEDSIDQKNKIASSAISTAKDSCTSSSDISEWPPMPSTGRYKTENFDLEQQIASLPKCNIEILNKKKK